MSITEGRDDLAVENERPADFVPRWRALLRSVSPMCVIRHRSLRGPFDLDGFIKATSDVHRQAAQSEELREKSKGIWRLERIGFSYCRDENGTLESAAIPLAVQPISHTGLGVAATESAEFCAERIVDLINPRAHPDFIRFAYESVGCIWGLHAHRMFQLIFRMVSQAQLRCAQLPPWAEFVGPLPPDVQQLVAHGYGRTLYIKNANVGSAVGEAISLKALDTNAAVQGIAFAYAMLNSSDLYRILEVGADFRRGDGAEGFQAGLIAALALWEWTFSGFLDGLEPWSPHQVDLIEKARQRVDASRRAGHLSDFGFA